MTDSPYAPIPAPDVPADGFFQSPAVTRLFRHVRRTVFALVRVVERWAAALLRAVVAAWGAALVAAAAAVKVLACVAAGAGAGLLTVGFFALEQPAMWDYQVLRRFGPPLAPVLIGGGVSLLTAELLLLAVFWRGARQARQPR